MAGFLSGFRCQSQSIEKEVFRRGAGFQTTLKNFQPFTAEQAEGAQMPITWVNRNSSPRHFFRKFHLCNRLRRKGANSSPVAEDDASDGEVFGLVRAELLDTTRCVPGMSDACALSIQGEYFAMRLKHTAKKSKKPGDANVTPTTVA